MVFEKNIKDINGKGYTEAPPKAERVTTRGRFNVPVMSASEHFIIDKGMKKAVNPITW